MSRQHLFERMQSLDLPTLEEKLNALREQLLISEDYTEDQIDSLKCTFARFKSQMKERWLKAHKNKTHFSRIIGHG